MRGMHAHVHKYNVCAALQDHNLTSTSTFFVFWDPVPKPGYSRGFRLDEGRNRVSRLNSALPPRPVSTHWVRDRSVGEGSWKVPVRRECQCGEQHPCVAGRKSSKQPGLRGRVQYCTVNKFPLVVRGCVGLFRALLTDQNS